MDLTLLYVYGLIVLIGLGLFIIVGILGLILISLANINRERGREYLKNITYAIVGGIIAVILLELRGDSWKNPMFYFITMPMSIGVIFVFILLGFLYFYLIDKLFDFLETFDELKQSRTQSQQAAGYVSSKFITN